MKRKVNKLSGLTIKEISLVDRPANEGARVTLFKMRDSAVSGGTTAIHKEATMADMTIEDLAKALSEAETENTALKGKVDELTKRAEQAESQIAQIEKLNKDPLADLPQAARDAIAKANADAEALKAQLAKMQDDRLVTEYVGKAAALQNLPIKAETFGPVLKRLYTGTPTPDDLTEMDRVLKAASEAIRITNATVSGTTSAPAHGSAAADLMAKAKEIQKAENVTIEKAQDLAMQRNPDLYSRFMAERRAAAN